MNESLLAFNETTRDFVSLVRIASVNLTFYLPIKIESILGLVISVLLPAPRFRGYQLHTD